MKLNTSMWALVFYFMFSSVSHAVITRVVGYRGPKRKKVVVFGEKFPSVELLDPKSLEKFRELYREQINCLFTFWPVSRAESLVLVANIPELFAEILDAQEPIRDLFFVKDASTYWNSIGQPIKPIERRSGIFALHMFPRWVLGDEKIDEKFSPMVSEDVFAQVRDDFSHCYTQVCDFTDSPEMIHFYQEKLDEIRPVVSPWMEKFKRSKTLFQVFEADLHRYEQFMRDIADGAMDNFFALNVVHEIMSSSWNNIYVIVSCGAEMRLIERYLLELGFIFDGGIGDVSKTCPLDKLQFIQGLHL